MYKETGISEKEAVKIWSGWFLISLQKMNKEGEDREKQEEETII